MRKTKYFLRNLIVAGGVLASIYYAMDRTVEKWADPEDINEENEYLDLKGKWHEQDEKYKFVECTIYEKWIKPVVDKGISFIGLVVLSPLFILVSLAVYIDDPGPVFFAQKRVGKDKCFFLLHKFRSMKMSAPHDTPTHMLENPDAYITRVGKIIRKTSLDELPQIWDIFRGKMSIIGPRPALWNQDNLIFEREIYNANNVFPGLTGLAQISGRDELEIVDKARIDGEYVRRLRSGSISAAFQDIYCFWCTICSVLKHEGIVEGGTQSMNKQKCFGNNLEIRENMEEKNFSEAGFEDYGCYKSFHINRKEHKYVLITGQESYIGENFKKYVGEHYQNICVDTLDMLDDSWRNFDFSGYDTVIHLAGIAHADIDKIDEVTKAKYYAVNTDLAIETAKRAKEAGVLQFIFMSSMLVYGDPASYGNKKVITEDTIPEPTNFYGDSKWQAEIGIRRLNSDEFAVAVLRAPMIYGYGAKGNYPLLAKFARKLPFFPNVDNERSILYIDNLCEFLSMLVLSGERGIYFPQNLEYSNTKDLVKNIAKVWGKNIRFMNSLKLVVAIGDKIPGRNGRLIRKAFGNIIYCQTLSTYRGLEYRKINLKDSIRKTEFGIETRTQKVSNYNGEKELVSIIMPVYNCEAFIREAIDSVKQQTYTNWELIIVDDCSTDFTASIIQKYIERDDRIYYLKNKVNSGAAASRNKAIKQAKGQYLAFLDGDDIWKKDKLAKQINFMRANNYYFSCTSYNKIDECGNELNKIIKAFTLDYEGLLRQCPGNSTVIYDANWLGKHITPSIKKRNDYVMWLKVIKKAKVLHGFDEVLSSHRIVSNSISSNKVTLVKYHWIVYKDIEKLGRLKSLYLVGFWIMKTLL